MDGQNLVALEAAHDGPFRFKHAGQTYTVVGPADLKVYQVLAILEARHIPGTPRMSMRQRDLLFERWAAHYDLPDLDRMRRLCYLVDRYRDEIEFDLQARDLDLTALWQQRRWRFLLNVIDHLPRNCWYSQAVANDPEHAEMIARQMANRPEGESERPKPPMHTWSPEVDMLAKAVDAIRAVNHTLAVVNSEKGKSPKPPEPEARPESVVDKLVRSERNKVRSERHKALTQRLLPHKRPGYVAKPKPTYRIDKNGRARDARGRFVRPE